MFVKTAKADSVLDLEQTGEFTVRIARQIKADGEAREINFQEILAKTAKRFDISDNPQDYIIEVIRANTANVPNENGDGFDKSELLSWAEDEGCPVYMTYVGCPHHINHDSENDKLARGIIIDAHYNDSAPPFDNCKLCGSETRHASQRSDDGIHCLNCGAVAKDEWVEIVVATDRVKDPDLAEAKVAKIIDSGSMGCIAQQTNCNVCGNLATEPSEFCDHLQRGNKKGWYVIYAGKDPEKIELTKVRSLLASANMPGAMSVDPSLIYSVNTPKFKIRKATERCRQVRYQEYSAVDRPADPKAEHIEMLKSASKQIKERTGSLVISSRLKKIENDLRSIKAQQEELKETDELQDNKDVPELPPEAEDLPNITIEDLIEEVTTEDVPERTFGEWGVLNYDQHSSLPNHQTEIIDQNLNRISREVYNFDITDIISDRKDFSKIITSKEKYKMLNVITAKWKAALTNDGKMAFVDENLTPIFVVSAKDDLKNNKESATKLASIIRRSIDKNGLTSTFKKFNAKVLPKFGQIMEDAWVNYEFSPHGKDPGKEPSSSNEEGRDFSTQEGFKPPKMPKDTLDGQSETYDNKARKTKNDTVQDSGFANQDDAGANRPNSGGDTLSVNTGASATHDLSMQDNSGKHKSTMDESHFSYSASSHEEDEMDKEAEADGKGRPTSNLDSVSLEQPNGINQEQPREAQDSDSNMEEAELEKEGQNQGLSGITVNMPDGSVLPVEQFLNNKSSVSEMGRQNQQGMAKDMQNVSFNSVNPSGPDFQMSPEDEAEFQRQQNRSGSISEEDLEITLNKLKRAFSAKAEELEKKYKEKEEDLEKEKEAVKQATIESLIRCARIVTKRFELDQEDSPLKYAFRDKIATEQEIFSGENGLYEGLPLDLANYLTASAYSEASQDEIDLILERAVDLLNSDGRYIASLESDLINLEPQEIHVKSASIASHLDFSISDMVKTALLEGNPILRSSEAVQTNSNNSNSIRRAIRSYTTSGQFSRNRSGDV